MINKTSAILDHNNFTCWAYIPTVVKKHHLNLQANNNLWNSGEAEMCRFSL